MQEAGSISVPLFPQNGRLWQMGEGSTTATESDDIQEASIGRNRQGKVSRLRIG